MRVALTGWDVDDAVAAGLAALGADLVAFTRWFPDTPPHEDCGGWIKVRCPHQIGGSLAAESWSFRDAVLRRASESGLGHEFDVIHALDPLSRPAAMGLKERAPAGVAIGSVAAADLTDVAIESAAFLADRWVCDHPWVAERWRERAGAGAAVDVVLGRAAESGKAAAPPHEPVPDGPLAVLWVPRDAALDPFLVVEALARAREEGPGLWAVALGGGPVANALRLRLRSRGWGSAREPTDSTLAHWQHWVARASVVGVATPRPADDPAARAAWLLGVPVVRTDGRDARMLAGAIRDALFLPGRRERDVRAAAALAHRAVEPAAVSAGWLGVYLNALAGPGASASRATASASTPVPLAGVRSRLSLTAIAPREAYASWSVRPDDWSTALEWLGPDAPRASLALRLFDVTDIQFRGDNAHGFRDVELGPGERHRAIGFDAPGRSFAASLGVRSPRGGFHPLAHARVCHLPREELAPPRSPERLVRVLGSTL
jgi:hypothetical protein